MEITNLKPGFQRMAGLPGAEGRGLSLIGSLKDKRLQSVVRGGEEPKLPVSLVAYIQALLEMVKIIHTSYRPQNVFKKFININE